LAVCPSYGEQRFINRAPASGQKRRYHYTITKAAPKWLSDGLHQRPVCHGCLAPESSAGIHPEWEHSSQVYLRRIRAYATVLALVLSTTERYRHDSISV
jgi:hypothetical protein